MLLQVLRTEKWAGFDIKLLPLRDFFSFQQCPKNMGLGCVRGPLLFFFFDKGQKGILMAVIVCATFVTVCCYSGLLFCRPDEVTE